VLEVPTTIPILYPIAIVKRSGGKPEAQDFVAFIRSGKATSIFQKYGFGKP